MLDEKKILKSTTGNKQGWIHDAVQKAKEKVSQYQKDRAETKTQEKELRRQAAEKGRQTYFEERKKVLEKQAVDKAKARAKGTGGFMQSISQIASSQTKTKSKSVKPQNVFGNLSSFVSGSNNKKKSKGIFDLKL